MIALAAIAVVSSSVSAQSPPPPEPTPLTDVQREMLAVGMFESDSFREPAFEALVENIRSWPEGAEPTDAVHLNTEQLDRFTSSVNTTPGFLVIATGEVAMIDPVGDAFPGVSRLTLKTGDRVTPRALLVFDVDQSRPAIGSDIRVIGRAYKVMTIPTQQSDAPTPFPAVVGRHSLVAAHASPAQPSNSAPAIITALTGALAVVFFVIVMGRHMLRPPSTAKRKPLASKHDPPDDLNDA